MDAGQISPSLIEGVETLALTAGGGGNTEAAGSLEGKSSGAEERLPDLSSLVVPPEVYGEVDRLRKDLPRLVKDFHDARTRDPPNLDVLSETGTHLSLLVEDLSYAAEDNLDKAPLQVLADLDRRLDKEYTRGLHWSVVAENVEAFATNWLEPILAQIKDPASKPSMDETARRDAFVRGSEVSKNAHHPSARLLLALTCRTPEPDHTTPRSASAQPALATSPLARNSFVVESAPHARRRATFGEPTFAEMQPPPRAASTTPARLINDGGSHRPHRSSSSASLALMGSSRGKSYERSPWKGPKCSGSDASLSGSVAQGETAIFSAPLPPPVSASSASTVIPASTVRRRSSPSDARSPSRTAYSPSSACASSYAPSHSSAFSLRSSTAGSSDHPNSSSSAGSSHKGRAGSTRRNRPPGLTMMPRRTNFVLAGHPFASEVTPTYSAVATRPASATRLPPNMTAAPVANAASTKTVPPPPQIRQARTRA